MTEIMTKDKWFEHAEMRTEQIDDALSSMKAQTCYLPYPPEITDCEAAVYDRDAEIERLVGYLRKLSDSLKRSYGIGKVDARILSGEINSYVTHYKEFD